MGATVTCSKCGEKVDLAEASSARCPSCSAPLNVTIDLQTGRLLVAPLVLVVDDEELSRHVARAVLEREGYEVLEASNGPDAALLAAEHLPPFVLLDQRMPAMTGEDTSKLIRRMAPDAVIIAFSAVLDGRPPWADAHLAKDRIDSLAEMMSSLSETRLRGPGGS